MAPKVQRIFEQVRELSSEERREFMVLYRRLREEDAQRPNLETADEASRESATRAR